MVVGSVALQKAEVFQNEITTMCVAGFVEQRAKTASFHRSSQLLLRNVRFRSCQAEGKCGVLLTTVQQMIREIYPQRWMPCMKSSRFKNSFEQILLVEINWLRSSTHKFT